MAKLRTDYSSILIVSIGNPALATAAIPRLQGFAGSAIAPFAVFARLLVLMGLTIFVTIVPYEFNLFLIT